MEIIDESYKERVLNFLKGRLDLSNIKSIILAAHKDKGFYNIDFYPKQNGEFDFKNPLYRNKEMRAKELSGYENSPDIAVVHIDKNNNMQLSSDIDFKSEDTNMVKDEQTVKEKLIEEFTAAIADCLGDVGDQIYEKNKVSNSDIATIARKVRFYMDEDLINDTAINDEIKEIQMDENEIKKIIEKSIKDSSNGMVDKLFVNFNGNNINIKGVFIPYYDDEFRFVEKDWDVYEGDNKSHEYEYYKLDEESFADTIGYAITKHYNIDDYGELIDAGTKSKTNVGADGNLWFDFEITLSLIPSKDLALKEANEQKLVENKK